MNIEPLIDRIFDTRVAPFIKNNRGICLPCYMIRPPYWEQAKAHIDKKLPQGWTSSWNENRNGSLIFHAPAPVKREE